MEIRPAVKPEGTLLIRGGGGASLLTLALVGCVTDIGGLPTYWNFDNRTQDTVTVIWHRESGEQVDITTIEAGEAATVDVDRYGDSRDVCSDGEFVFTTAAGEVVMRGTMSCNPWVIAASPGQT